MSIFDDIKKGTKLILNHPVLGFVRATAAEDYSRMAGASAVFDVYVNSETLLGVSAMTINTNTWEVYDQDDPEILKKIVDKYLPKESVR